VWVRKPLPLIKCLSSTTCVWNNVLEL
jgi:hypothetical protein